MHHEMRSGSAAVSKCNADISGPSGQRVLLPLATTPFTGVA